MDSMPVAEADAEADALREDLAQNAARVANWQAYQAGGAAYLLSSRRSHQLQRFSQHGGMAAAAAAEPPAWETSDGLAADAAV